MKTIATFVMFLLAAASMFADSRLFQKNTEAAVAAAIDNAGSGSATTNTPEPPRNTPAVSTEMACAQCGDRVAFAVWSHDVREAWASSTGYTNQRVLAQFERNSVVDIKKLPYASGDRYAMLDQRGRLIFGSFAGPSYGYNSWPIAPAYSMRVVSGNSVIVSDMDEVDVQYTQYWSLLETDVVGRIGSPHCISYSQSARGDDFCTDVSSNTVYQIRGNPFVDKSTVAAQPIFFTEKLVKAVADGNSLWVLTASDFEYPQLPPAPIEGGGGMCYFTKPLVMTTPGRLLRVPLHNDGTAGNPETVLSGLDIDYSAATGLAARNGRVYFTVNGPRNEKGVSAGMRIMLYDSSAKKLSVFVHESELPGPRPFVAGLAIVN